MARTFALGETMNKKSMNPPRPKRRREMPEVINRVKAVTSATAADLYIDLKPMIAALYIRRYRTVMGKM